MAANMNLVVLAGNLTRDPEMKALPSGQTVTNLGLAVNRAWVDKDGEKHEDTLFVTVVAWARPASCARNT